MAGKYPNSGTLGRNKRRESDKHPEYTGSAEIDGQEFWISAWLKEGSDGKFFSLSFKPKEQKQGGGGGKSQGSSQRSSQREPGDEDDTPF